MPSSRKARQAIIHYLRSRYANDLKTIFELGSGWGGLSFSLARAFPLMHLHAFEISPFPWFISYILQKLRCYPNFTLHRKNFFRTSFAQADLIVCYLYPGAMHKLKSKFEKELKSGTWIISYCFAIPGWIPEKVIKIQDVWASQILVYKVS